MAEEIGAMTVRLQGDTKQFQQSMKDAEKQTKTSADGMAQNLAKPEKASQKLGASLVENVGKASAAIAAMAGFGKVVTDLAGLTVQQANLNRELERTATLTDKALASQDQRVSKTIAEAQALGSVEDQRTAIAEQIKLAEKNLGGVEGALKRSREQFDKLNIAGEAFARSLPLVGGGRQAKFDEAVATVKEAEKRYGAASETVRKLREELEKLSEASRDKAFAKSSDDLAKAFRFQRETLGKTTEEIELYKLKLAGASDARLKQADAEATWLIKARAGIEETKRLAAETKALRDANVAAGEALEQQFLTPLEKYERQVKRLNDLLDAGALNDDTFERAIAGAAKELEDAVVPVKDLNQQFERLEGAISGTAEASSRIRNFRSLIGGQLAGGPRGGLPGERIGGVGDAAILRNLQQGNPGNPAFGGEQGKKQADLLKDIRDILKAQKQRNNNRPIVEPAGF